MQHYLPKRKDLPFQLTFFHGQAVKLTGVYLQISVGIFIPGSSRYVKFLPRLVGFSVENAQNLHPWKIQVYRLCTIHTLFTSRIHWRSSITHHHHHPKKNPFFEFEKSLSWKVAQKKVRSFIPRRSHQKNLCLFELTTSIYRD